MREKLNENQTAQIALLDGQGVDVRAQQDRGTRAVAQDGDLAVAADRGADVEIRREGFEARGDQRGGLLFLG